MYEENRDPLPRGDVSIVFADVLAEMKTHVANVRSTELTSESVVRWADYASQPHFVAMCRRLLLPESGVFGLENLHRLVELGREGNSCLLCLNHRSNLDVPILGALLEDQGESELFKKIIWVAGRKLEEDVGLTSMLVQCFNRVIVSPPSWFASPRTEPEIHEGRQINIAAERAIASLRHEGWVFAMFPAGTRIRPGNESTEQAIAQMDSYLRLFDYVVLCNIDGCTLPVSKDRDLTHETPRLDRMRYTFGPLRETKQWRIEAAARYGQLDQRSASALAIQEEIAALTPQS
ncbi:MAG: 1-acyl-sn-glycerol-3-phosphate acyltransferase [Pirellulaceae bacterium]|nr:1-acyl-sn-glycerol-3-phosphate acyltransferase [Pirellulaceae bacterium]